MRRGHQGRVPTPGTNRKRAIFGALERTTGRWLYAITERKRAVEFIAFLEQVLAGYPDRPILLVVDNASIHVSPGRQSTRAPAGHSPAPAAPAPPP